MLDEKSSVCKWSSKSANTKYRRPNREQRPALPCRCPPAPFCPVDSRYLSGISTLPGMTAEIPEGKRHSPTLKHCPLPFPSLSQGSNPICLRICRVCVAVAASVYLLLTMSDRFERAAWRLLLLLLRFSGGGETKMSTGLTA